MKRTRSPCIAGARRALELAGLGLLSACSTWPRLEATSSTWATADVALGAEEAACLAAEVLAYEFTATSRDPMQPTAHAVDLGSGSWLVHYERGPTGPLMPRTNGTFVRERPDIDGTLLGAPPLGRIRFAATQLLASPPPVVESVSIEVEPREPRRCRVRTRGLGERRSADLFDLLVFVADLRAAFDLVGTGQHEALRQQLLALTGRHRAGFSAIHDPLLAQAWSLLAHLEIETGRPAQARRAVAQARLLAPSAAQLALLQARLHERFADPQSAKESLVVAAELAGGVDTMSRAAAFVARGVEAPRSLEERYRAALERSGQALVRHEVEGAAAWAHRALDARPGSGEALTRLAMAIEAGGDARDARDLRLMALQGCPDNPEDRLDLVRAITHDEARRGDPALALRTALRRSAQWPQLLDDPCVASSARALGWERTLRILRSEGFGTDAAPLALSSTQQSDPRQAFVGRLLAIFSTQARQLPAGEPRSTPTEPAFGASGLAAPAR